MFKLTDEQINRAAIWWADIVTRPKFDGLTDKERKDPANNAYQLAEMMAATMIEDIDTEQQDKFTEALKDELRSKDYNPYLGLHVDYHPDPALADAAEKAGMSKNNFPWKTSMWFKEDGSVSVACGYGKQPLVLLGPARASHS